MSTTATGCQATGVALGGATITAVVTKGSESTNVGSEITVTDDASAVVPINSINQGGVPAVSPFGGQLDVVINVERGDQVLEQLDLLVDGGVVASQTFGIAGAPADDDAAEQAIQTITLSFLTAAYDVLTGAVDFLNGDHIISAQLSVAGATTPIASNTIAVMFLNADGFHVNGDLGDNTALDAAGLIWWGGPTNGPIDISVIPVNYSGGTTESVTVGYCGAAPVTVAPGPYDFSFSGAAGDPCAGYSTVGGPVVFAAGDTPGITSVQDGAAGPGGAGSIINIDHPFPGPIDFLGPGTPLFTANPNGRQNGWINGAVGLTGANDTPSATDDDWINMPAGSADTGVGGYNRWLRSDLTAPGTTDAAVAATPEAAPALPAPTVNNDDICFVTSASDDLGNESALPAAGTTCTSPPFDPFLTGANLVPIASHVRGGVDTMVPTIAFDATSLAADALIWNPTVMGEFVVTVSDLGAVGNSGMLSGAPVIGRLETRAPGSVCGDGDVALPGTVPAGGGCVNSATGIGGVLPLQGTTGVAVLPVPLGPGAYYTFTGLSQDAAGNQSPEVSRVVVRDGAGAAGVAPSVVATPPAVPITITGAFLASSFLNDDLSIADYYWTAGFTTALTALPAASLRLASAPTVVDAFNSATLTNTNLAVNTTVNTFLGLQPPAAAYVPGSNPHSSVTLFARDQTQTATVPPDAFAGPGYSSSGPAAVGPTAPATGIAVMNVAPAWTFTAYAEATSAPIVCAGIAGAPACTATPTTTATWTATATGTTATFPNPFSRVDFYLPDAPFVDMVLIGSVSASAATLVDDGATRFWTYSLAVTGSDVYAKIGGVSPAMYTRLIHAIGVNAAGDVGMVSPFATAFTVEVGS